MGGTLSGRAGPQCVLAHRGVVAAPAPALSTVLGLRLVSPDPAPDTNNATG
ncbi:hypothetical protein MPC1_4630003 [Methylocella tundrae]|nr:hypothetical protein MPC1_4630003 [Methylocella tundrae]